jgi:serine/threonine protein kinase
MLETTCCPDCGAELPTGATGGLCPRCLLGAGISSDSPFELPAESPFAATTPQAGGFVPPPPASLAEYFPDLEVLEIIGQGGMGAVYKARQTKLDRLVALKVIRPESADDPAFTERFTREAKTLARLNHSNIVSIHDFGEFEPAAPGLAAEPTPSDTSGRTGGSVGDRPQHEERPQTASRKLFYFVMEFVDGANLRQLMESGQLQPSQSLAIVPQICDALQYAHDEGVIHRDIKPENILIDRRGRVKIADFGLAKLAGQSPENFTLTGTHQVMGTPRYMAPEQMSGSRLVDHRVDIYSLGVVLYEMLTGELPMGRFEAPSHKAAVDARLDDVVHRALESNPDRRYQRASEIRTDMESIALNALSHGELESVDASFASGFPGPSTIMERQVAGVVNWFKGVRTPNAGPRPVPWSPSDRAAIQQQVRGPGMALIIYGGLIACAGLLTTVVAARLFATSIFVLVLPVAALVLGTMICRGGWHLLTLERYGPAVLAGLLGQPVGIWALVRLSRDDVRAAFASGPAATRGPIATVLLSTTFWGVLIAGGGVGVTFLPWAQVYDELSSDPGVWVAAAGFGWPHGMIACSVSIVAALFLLASGSLRPVPIWRPLTIVVLAGVILACSGSFLLAFENQSLAAAPLFDAEFWRALSADRTPPRTIAESGLATRILYGPYLLLGFAAGLLVISAVDFRAGVQPVGRTNTGRVRTDFGAPRFSRKAIVGACWAPLFFLALVGFTVTSDVMAHRSHGTGIPVPGLWTLIPGSVVGILGLLAPFATTILGMLAVSDIRHAPSRVRGLGLAYFDAIFFPLLIMDAVLMFGVGVLISVLFQSGISSVFAMMLGGPLCLILDAAIAVWGWRKVSQLLDDNSRGVTPRSEPSGGGVSHGMHSTPQSVRTADAPTLTPTPVTGVSARTTSVEVRRMEFRLKAPAAGLMVAAFLHLLFWGVMGSVMFYEAWGMHRGRFDATIAEMLGASACAIAVLLVVGTIIQGARHLRRVTGIGWCYAAAIFSIIPWSMASIVAIPVGIWVIRILGNADVKEAFVQRSLELDRNPH